MPSFLVSAFAIGGLIAALGPIVIHLLNRRRYRVIEWAAMDFLREAIQRNRKMIQWRDLLLMLLRVAAVLLFGLAMARPFFNDSDVIEDSDHVQVHAVIVLDNSMSMGYLQLNETLLDKAKEKARDLVDQLTDGSVVSIAPLCQSSQLKVGAYRSKDDALEGIDSIQIVDQSGTASQAAEIAKKECDRVPEIPTKKIYFIGDQQRINWPKNSIDAELKNLNEMRVVQVDIPNKSNAWVDDFYLQEGIADIETDAVFQASIRYEGLEPREGVEVNLEVDGVPIGTKVVDLQPGQSREVSFTCRLEQTPEPGRPAYSKAHVWISADELPRDDEKSIVVPVVSSLPVVFIDQYGEEDENPRKFRLGETYRLRSFLAPKTSRSEKDKQLFKISHIRMDQLTQEILENTRLVVIAGVDDPTEGVDLLKEYVDQGGKLVIAAGGDFDPVAWNDAAWKDGLGILPVPLKPDFVGELPKRTDADIEFFRLDANSIIFHPYFRVEQESDQLLLDLYRHPFFFQAVEADVSPEVLSRLDEKITEELQTKQDKFLEFEEKLEAWKKKESDEEFTETDRIERDALINDMASMTPDWLLWSTPNPVDFKQESAEELAALSKPRVIGTFDKKFDGNSVPFMVERKIGQGQVIWFGSGISPRWNTLTVSPAVLCFDRIFRSMLKDTFPERNYTSTERVEIPITATDRRLSYTLLKPDGAEVPLSVDALGGEEYGLQIYDVSNQGVYTVQAADSDVNNAVEKKEWELTFAVASPNQESELTALTTEDFAERVEADNAHWIEEGDTLDLSGTHVHAQVLWRPLRNLLLNLGLPVEYWKLLLLGVLIALVVEMVILALPAIQRRRSA